MKIVLTKKIVLLKRKPDIHIVRSNAGTDVSKYLKRFDLSGRMAVVTGASEGIGRELALGLAEAGADVILCSRREAKLREVKSEIENKGRRAEIFALDICKLSQIEDLKAFILKHCGRVEILVNNAGYAITKPAWLVTEEEWDFRIS